MFSRVSCPVLLAFHFLLLFAMFRTAISISLTRFSEPSATLHQSLESLARQRNVHARILVLDQREDEESRTYCRGLSTPDLTFEYDVIQVPGLSRARNRAIQSCETDLLLFIDPDAIADPDWAIGLAKTLSRTGVAVAGSRIIPAWKSDPPMLTRSPIVCEQFSLLDHGRSEQSVRKVFGAGFGLNLRTLDREARFDENLGRKPGGLLGGEETELCERARAGGHEVRYNGAAVVRHQISAERATNRWILRRLYYSGVTRARRGGKPRAAHRQRCLWNWLFFPAIVTPYAAGYFKEKISGPSEP